MGGNDEDNGLSAGAIYDTDSTNAQSISFVRAEGSVEFVCAALGLGFHEARPPKLLRSHFVLRDLDTGEEMAIEQDSFHGPEGRRLALILPIQDAYVLGRKSYTRETLKSVLSAALKAYRDAKYNPDHAWTEISGSIRFVHPKPVETHDDVVPEPVLQAEPVSNPPVKPKRRLPILKWLAMTAGALVAFSLVQVCVYRFVPVPVTILMIERLTQGNGLDHRWVGASDISDNLKSAVIAAEDAKFCTHDGFDYDAIKKAEAYNATHKKKRGASTISQQTAKNVFLWPSRSWTRKGFEVWYTFLIEHLWTKDRIMEVYLNSVEWGPGVYGAESASQYWFHHSARTLSPAEASKLAAILPDPDKWKATGSGHYVSKRSGSIQARARSASDGCAVE
jgi:monofunctional biosynthetic peptidoglycan transglycosylase